MKKKEVSENWPNFSIRKNFKTEEEDEIEVKSKKTLKPKDLIIKLADLHDSLLDSVVKVNNCFAFQVNVFLEPISFINLIFQIMMCLASYFVFNIFNLFGIYRIFVRENLSTLFESSIQSAWNFYFLSLCFLVITLCSLLTRSGKFSAVLCHKAINYSDDDSIVGNVSDFELIELNDKWFNYSTVQVIFSAAASSFTCSFMWTFYVWFHTSVHSNNCLTYLE